MSTFPEIMPVLSPGRHRSPRQGACFMEFASYLAGERWSDHPACTHPALASLARDVNDLVSDSTRSELVALIHRVIGLNSPDPHVGVTIAVRAATAAYPVASQERQRALAAGMLNLLDTIDDPRLRALADDAFRQSPDGELWARRYLATSAPPRRTDARAAAAITHTAVVGIALACVPDADSRLADLLSAAIDDVEAMMRPSPAQAHTLVSL
ncbi:MAG: hypothetical protein Q8M65_00120 [Rhodoglobus sp.]|nr:hypothetical protein [Rhodoglobus sp.]